MCFNTKVPFVQTRDICSVARAPLNLHCVFIGYLKNKPKVKTKLSVIYTNIFPQFDLDKHTYLNIYLDPSFLVYG